MFGLAVIAPWARRSRMRPEMVGCASPKRWSGLGKAVALHVPHRGLDEAGGGGPADGERDARVVAAELVSGAAEEVLGDDVGAAAGGEGRRLRCVRRVDGDVHRRVAHAEHDHVAVPQLLRVRVLVRVHLLTGEAVGAREGGLGPAGVPVVPVGDDHRVEALAVDVPAVALLPDALHRRLEADVLAEAEVVDVGVEVRGDLRVVREVRIRLRHREVRVLHPLPARVDVQRRVRRRHPVLVAEDPVAADAVRRLVGDEVDPPLMKRLRGRDPARALADDRDS